MILPILRLVLIYFLLVAGVVAVFNRDKLAPLLPGGSDRAVATDSGAEATPEATGDTVAEGSDAADTDTASTGAADTGAADTGAGVAETGDTAGAASGPVVTPAPGIAPETPLQVAPAETDTATDTATDMATDTAAPVFPEASPRDAETDSAAAPEADAKPGSPGAPVPLGTPVASAPALTTPDAPTSDAAATDAVSAPAAPTAEAAAQAAPSTPAPTGAAELTAPVAEPVNEPASEPTADQLAAPTPTGTAEPVAPAAAIGDAPPLADAIAAARAAYWAGDIEAARGQMTALSAANPDNPDVAGELGNLAFALRDYPAAAEAWQRAGELLIARGESARVMSFLPFLQSIAPDKAAELAAQMQER